jgi:hypothetical protein
MEATLALKQVKGYSTNNNSLAKSIVHYANINSYVFTIQKELIITKKSNNTRSNKVPFQT